MATRFPSNLIEETKAGLTADAFLTNDPMAVNLMLHSLDDAMVMMMAMEGGSLRRSTDCDNRHKSNCGSEKDVFHGETS